MNDCFGRKKANAFLWEAKLEKVQERTGFRFRDFELLKQAMTHSSYRHEAGLASDNERLEYLGDAVLELLVTERLVELFPAAGEGELTRRRADLVCEECLSEREKELDLFECLRLGKGMEKQCGRWDTSARADALEAFLGALYLDGGFFEASRFVRETLFPEGLVLGKTFGTDPKSMLQERCQELGKAVPEYFLVEKTGQEDAPLFVAGVRLEGEILATGSGHSKKEAEFNAAKHALEAIT